MKRTLLIALCYLSFANVTAQSGFNDQLAAGNNNMLSVKKTNRNNVKVKGTPYIIEQFQPITISGQSDKVFQGRYNGFNGDMEVLDVKKGVVFVLNRLMTNYDVNFTGQRKIYRSYKFRSDEGSIDHGFFVTLVSDDDVSLLKKENVKFLKEVKAISTLDKARDAQYKPGKDQYFIKIKDTPAIEFSIKKKEINSRFPEKAKDIQRFIKSEKIKFSKEVDLITLVNYINTL